VSFPTGKLTKEVPAVQYSDLRRELYDHGVFSEVLALCDELESGVKSICKEMNTITSSAVPCIKAQPLRPKISAVLNGEVKMTICFS
jgi:hypothetical protein